MYLASWKEFLPAVEHVPHWLEGNPSSWSLASPLKVGYPWINARIPAAADGIYPPAGADADADGQFAGKSSQISGFRVTISISLSKTVSKLIAKEEASLKGGYPWIPARIPAEADGYPPAGADGQFSGKSSRISGCRATISNSLSKTALKLIAKEEASAFKTELKKYVNPNLCSKGLHNPKAAHAEWKCHKLTGEQRIAAGPASGHVTSAKEVESNYVKVSVYLNFGSDTSKPVILNLCASHHMINYDTLFKKIKEVNIEINTGNHKQRVVAVASRQIQIINDAKNLITLDDVLFTPDLNQSLI
ncbi:uncharacterized protein PGTG_12141 [Puccinia graminis f. sp. tritici CRL 75-36-700-3]|uniref:Retrovirus-related Pol polyprotein from transposon TNT 1-94-like beta-barrel domain-containing protein n=1 Tax=Puccinia graminis f. sp. tritici (strain CRL 75-36-700-3 / race SCCL) TaxID=418459 RepID=E3KPZ2_PUCGT|nr:uncharacterized protein PGTG_12141 [Puccinia graminis f. sp. tritici CRL 75-36-700-3]EFP86185.2 hypothetical protein PGTG_12141 [Puccinia graminis f. sp. tritici CRL 75-36-700-3]